MRNLVKPCFGCRAVVMSLVTFDSRSFGSLSASNQKSRWSVTYIGIMSARRRIFLVVVAVPAIIVGLLAMHFLAGADEVSPATMTMSVGTTSGSVAAPIDCGLSCITSSDMTMTMTCVLALLVTVIVLTVLSALIRRDRDLFLELVSLWRARIASLPPPIPPSLHVLSISRI